MEIIENVLSPLKVGDNVLVSIPSVDRWRGDAANLLAIIIEKKMANFVLGLKKGF
jgi:hypothetical protein